jgi:hypothetical protein
VNARAFRPRSMSVYDGTRAIGRIVETGRRQVEAYRFEADAEQFLGTYSTRQEAMRAVSTQKDS